MLLIISLDSESLEWLDQQMDSGMLPNLEHLIRGGCRLPVDAAVLPGVAYPTLYSGLRPADVGLYFPVQWCAEQQRVLPWTQLPEPRTVFQRADEAGMRTIVLDPPECAPTRLEHGFSMSGLQFRARVLLHPWTTDRAETRRLEQMLGRSPRGDEVFGLPTTTELRRLRKALVQAPARLTTAALHLLRDNPPECLWLTCCAMHIAGHQFYDLGLLGDPQDRREFEGVRLEVARGYDRMLGELMDALPAGADVMVFYAKGMTAAHGWGDLLPNMLRRVLNEPDLEQPIAALRRLAPRGIRRRLADLLPDSMALSVMAKIWNPSADWRTTRAFCAPSDSIGFVRLNVRGRERDGCVADSDRQGLAEQIRAGLETFTDTDGEPCIGSIRTTEEVFGSGKASDRFPDLMVFWNPKPNLLGGGVRSPRFGEIVRTTVGTGRSGFHGPGAMAIVVPGRGKLNPVGRSVQAQDIPATLLSSLGLPCEDLPGRSLLARSMGAQGRTQ